MDTHANGIRDIVWFWLLVHNHPLVLQLLLARPHAHNKHGGCVARVV